MLFTRITLNNCGAYAGRHEFDLSTGDGRPVILVGGRNGGGKTTLFESVLLCLYGMRYSRTTKKDYEKRLLQLIHRNYRGELAEREEWSSIRVEFLLYRGGRVDEYAVERRWRRVRDGVSEEMLVERSDMDDAPLGPDQTQSFVNGLIPRGIADLFFFDGEMISQMAESGESSAMRSSFDSLLGLDMVEQLQADLRTNLTRNLTGDDRHLQEELSMLTAQKEEMESGITHLRESLIRKEADIGRVRAGIEDAEAKLDLLGGSYARGYQDTRSELASRRAEQEMIGRRITELCSGDLPFGLMPQEMEGVREQILSDRAASQRAVEYRTITMTVGKIRSAIESLDSIPKNVMSAVIPAVEDAMPGTPPAAEAEVFGFSTAQQEGIIRSVENASGPTPDAAREAAREYAEVREDVARLEGALSRAPADDEIGPLISEINKMHSEAGGLEAEIDHLETKISTEEAMIKHVSSKIRAALEGQYKNKKTQRMADLTKSVQKALETYADSLRAKKMSILESHITESARILMHKDLIKSVSIDPDTFELVLYGEGGGAVPREGLAKGEQQMLATAVLWALAKTSGRPLPFMIDTPMARLDHSHRTNLVEQFFPQASHQMLILSTDTEIGKSEYGMLLPYVSRAYTVRYAPESGGTIIRNGYFWDGSGNEIQ